MVQWIWTHFSICAVEKEVVEEAARRGHLWVLQLLENNNSHGVLSGVQNVRKTQQREVIVHWLHHRIGTSTSEQYRGTEVGHCKWIQTLGLPFS
ncbi:hypothetical protein PHMEG_00034133 [Phytophthora megakarya]|uniref:Uncharacterized protein n=1 Tax=Phytophthora megakarya TaxID=4795 RepID=A0A225UUC4_9STRA|nr:hypothetical protein PHMEG_00034133 [Phytophthora megakarya]